MFRHRIAGQLGRREILDRYLSGCLMDALYHYVGQHCMQERYALLGSLARGRLRILSSATLPKLRRVDMLGNLARLAIISTSP